MADRSKDLKSTIDKLADKIAELLRQPLSDESYEVPRPATVRRSKRVAGGRTAKRRTAKRPAAKRRTAKRRADTSRRRTKKA